MTNPAAERYSRQVLLKEWVEAGQRALSEAHFVVIGAGGIGSPALLALAEAGAGRITVIDSDTVDETNLPRQILHIPARIGMKGSPTQVRQVRPVVPPKKENLRIEGKTTEEAADLFLSAMQKLKVI